MIQHVSVIGAGTMGNGIAHVFAQHGFQVTLVDISEDALNAAMETISKNLDRQIKKEQIDQATKEKTLAHIRANTSLETGVGEADLVVEAATENSLLKQEIFRKIDAAAPENAILASNTSSISITLLGSCTTRPDKVIGMHFMNPVPVMKLVEVINGYGTSVDVSQRILSLSEQLGKTPCLVQDYPGFIANRILLPMINEAIYALQEGVAGVTEIDTVMRLGMSHPMGPLQLADFIGLDTCLSILKVLHNGFGQPKYAPCPLLVNMVQARKLGVKTGEGFYSYAAGSKTLVVSQQFHR